MDEMDLSGSDLSRVQFKNTGFTMGRHTKQKFSKCNFSRCNMMEGLHDCVFDGCVFTGAHCGVEEGCSFTGCKMDAMNLTVKDFTKLVFENVDLSGSKITSDTKQWENMELVGCNFSNTNIEITLVGCIATKCNFSKSKFKFGDGCIISECSCQEMDLNGQDFTKVEFIDVYFTGSNLSNCKIGKIVDPDLTGCNLSGTDLKDCNDKHSILSILNYKQYLRMKRVLQLSGKKAQLLYKASRDGFTTQAFHSKCNGKSPTITFIKTENG